MRIFVSSTYEDLKEYRQSVRDVIISKQHVPIMMEYIIPGGDAPKKECLKRIRQSDVVIGIYAYRYGSIPKGDRLSMTEQEYDYASKKNKKIFCFMPSDELKNRWPKEDIQETEEMKRFRGKLMNHQYIKFFKNAEELKYLISEVLPIDVELSLNKSLEDAREETKDIDYQKKLEIIDKLVEINGFGRMNDEALKITTKLVASNFRSYDEAISPEFVDHTKDLVTDNIIFNDFVDIANKSIKAFSIKKYLKFGLLIASIFFILGLGLGFLLYQTNFMDFRSVYLPPNNAEKINVMEWLTDKMVGDNIQWDNFSSPATSKAIFALSIAHELDPKNNKLISYLDKIRRDVMTMVRPRGIPVELLQSNLLILKKIYEYVSYSPLLEDINFLEVRVKILELDKDFNNSTISDKDLLARCKELWNKHRQQIDTTLIKQKILLLSKDVENFEYLQKFTISDTATITETKDLLQNFASSHRESPEKAQALGEIEKINDLISSNASISTPDNFVACRSISNLNPQGKSTYFSPGSICAWAQVRAPRNELVYFKWYANGELLHTFSVRVDHNLEPGYRVHSAKNYGSEYRGKQEVRLYNSQNQLIGRRVFYVG
jgi:hypothetical protein